MKPSDSVAPIGSWLRAAARFTLLVLVAVPLAYFTVDGKMLIVGSFAGAEHDPAWVHNVRATPKAHIEIGTDAYDVDVRELPADERAEVYPKLIERAPVFTEYQTRTTREFPLFELVRA